MQDPPSLIPDMLTIIETKEYDCVPTMRIDRKGESKIRSFFSKMFYRIINKISEVEIVDGARDFRMMNRQMVDAIINVSEKNRFSKGIFSWTGFNTYWIPYENEERVAGKTKWGFWQLTKYAIDGIINYSEVPLAIASWLGFLFSLIGFAAVAFIVIRKICFGDPVMGWASTVSIIVFFWRNTTILFGHYWQISG